MGDIVIYTNERIFQHKTEFSYEKNNWCYWSMKRAPKNFSVYDKIFLAHSGFVRGFVECEEFNPEFVTETIIWNTCSYEKLKNPIPCKAFRGFRYRWWKDL